MCLDIENWMAETEYTPSKTYLRMKWLLVHLWIAIRRLQWLTNTF